MHACYLFSKMTIKLSAKQSFCLGDSFPILLCKKAWFTGWFITITLIRLYANKPLLPVAAIAWLARYTAYSAVSGT